MVVDVKDIESRSNFFQKSLILSFFSTDFMWNKKGKVYNTKYSQAVTHPSTNFVQPDMTSVIRREPVLSWWYGRRRKILEAAHFLLKSPQFSVYSSQILRSIRKWKVYNTKYSQEVTHPSTNFAQQRLTSVI